MKRNDNLFKLIKSLTAKEKAYFKTINKSSANYIVLFDLMNKQKKYNEHELIEGLQGITNYDHKTFSVEKKYLYDKLLQSLILFNQSNLSQGDICIKLSQEADILFSKGLFNQANNRLRIAKKKAVKYDLYVEKRYLLDKELRFEIVNRQRGGERTESIYDEMSQLHEIMENANIYRKINNSIEIMFNSSLGLSHYQIINLLHQITNNKFITDESNAKCYVSKVYFHSIRFEYFNLIENFEAALKEAMTSFHLIQSNISRNSDYILLYSKVKLLRPLFKNGHIEQANIYFQEIKSTCASKRYLAKLLIINCYQECYLFYKATQSALLPKIIDDWTIEINKFRNDLKLIDWVVYFICLTDYQLMNSEFKKAQYYLNQITSIPITSIKLEWFISIRLFEIKIHYKLGNIDLIDSYVLSLRKIFKDFQIEDSCWMYEYLDFVMGKSDKKVFSAKISPSNSFVGNQILNKLDII